MKPISSAPSTINPRHFSSDFRVLYSLVRVDSSEVQQAFELFPGYKNLNDIEGAEKNAQDWQRWLKKNHGMLLKN